jgi:hypothetical protein
MTVVINVTPLHTVYQSHIPLTYNRSLQYGEHLNSGVVTGEEAVLPVGDRVNVADTKCKFQAQKFQIMEIK